MSMITLRDAKKKANQRGEIATGDFQTDSGTVDSMWDDGEIVDKKKKPKTKTKAWIPDQDTDFSPRYINDLSERIKQGI